LVQWWYGHNAVAFFLTTPVLGIMYYFVPKAADRPVYSYRLSIVHFWALVFLYIWAGPHHLLNTALPAWAQTLGMIFSIMLWAPSWGGMINGLFTIRGAWDALRSDPVLKFFAAGLTFYGMATFEGPLLSIRSVNAIAHYSDWIIGHVHAGALGWNGFMAAGMFYYLVPKLYGRELFSRKLANLHFYLGTFGILFYVVAMYVSAATQGGMWRATDATGALVYGGWAETVTAILPLYWLRLAGGSAYLIGMCIMAYNLGRTAREGAPVVAETEVVVPVPTGKEIAWAKIVFGRPVILVTIAAVCFASTAVVNESAGIFMASTGVFTAVLGTLAYSLTRQHGDAAWHRLLEGRAVLFTSLTVLAVLIGGVAELIPVVAMGNPAAVGHKPYSPLELEGRDVYIREGCLGCHSQQIRPLAWETARFGEPSTLAESSHDHPFLWGSKRTGPDLAREGTRNPDALWHYRHMLNPREISQGSNMPAYPHLKTREVDFGGTEAKLRAMRSVGVPYTPTDIQTAEATATRQGEQVSLSLRKQGADASPRSEMVALIAYLQCLGRTESSKTDPVAQH
jgi:cytochrome c oxidase cbb3-type subunit I/II